MSLAASLVSLVEADSAFQAREKKKKIERERERKRGTSFPIDFHLSPLIILNSNNQGFK